jgi:NADH:ubiquinone oxidoreductase subunit K
MLCNIAGRNLILLLLAIELLFFALSITCLVYYFNNAANIANFDLLFAAIAITVLAAAETAVGLALIVLFYKKTKTITIKRL